MNFLQNPGFSRVTFVSSSQFSILMYISIKETLFVIVVSLFCSRVLMLVSRFVRCVYIYLCVWIVSKWILNFWWNEVKFKLCFRGSFFFVFFCSFSSNSFSTCDLRVEYVPKLSMCVGGMTMIMYDDGEWRQWNEKDDQIYLGWRVCIVYRVNVRFNYHDGKCQWTFVISSYTYTYITWW